MREKEREEGREGEREGGSERENWIKIRRRKMIENNRHLYWLYILISLLYCTILYNII